MKKLNDIADYVNHLSFDLKAETLIALLQKDFIDSKDILVAFDGQLKRKYSKDISKAKVEEFENGEKVITIHLNRDGIYDSLPEDLFHSFSEESLLRGGEMARDSMKLKNEEKETRSFFQPFENQMLFQLVNLAAKENLLFNNLYTNLLQGLIPGFWKISKDIPTEYADRLIRLIPMAHQIVGDRDLTIQAFEFILQEQVTIDFDSSKTQNSPNDTVVSTGGGLGECKLGIDTYSGDILEVPTRTIRVSIGPVCRLELIHCLEGGWLTSLLECLYSYFLPMELAVDTSMVPGGDHVEFILNEEESNNITYLGYNSVL